MSSERHTKEQSAGRHASGTGRRKAAIPKEPRCAAGSAAGSHANMERERAAKRGRKLLTGKRVAIAACIVCVAAVGVTIGISAATGDGLFAVSAVKPAQIDENQIYLLTAETAPLSPTPEATPIPTPVPTPTPPALPTPTPEPAAQTLEIASIGTQEGYLPGTESEAMLEIQARLMELGYMDSDEPTTLYGPQTQEAMALFISKSGRAMAEDQRITDEDIAFLLSGDAKPYMASVNDSGDDIKELQLRLRELGYLKSATGKFGPETESAVCAFQEANGLTADGKIGPHTRELLYSADAKAKAGAEQSAGADMLACQKRLKDLGYLTTTPDGKDGADTKAAVKRFQEINGIIVDGNLGPDTTKLLLSDAAQPNALVLGLNGDDIARVQARLIALGYMEGNATGYFGSATQTAVQAFQKNNGLTEDGKVGRATMKALMSSDAKAAQDAPAKTPAATKVPEVTNTPKATKAPAATKTAKPTKAPAETKAPQKTKAPEPAKDPEKTKEPEATKAPEAPKPNITGANVQSLISVASSKLGSPYVRAAKGPDSFDCSGFVYWCLNQIGVRQSYMTSYAWRTTDRFKRIESMGEIKAGDIVVFKMGETTGHVGIAINGSTMIDASTNLGKVVKRSLNTNYWKESFFCAYRVF